MKKIYLFATIAAIIAGFATYWFANDIKQSFTFVDVEKIQVVVAAVDIDADTRITDKMLTFKSYPADSVSPNSVTDKTKIVGKMALYPMYKNEQINNKYVVTLGAGTSDNTNDKSATQNKMSYKLKKGEYAFTFEVNATTSDGYNVQDGDYVNLIITNAKSADTTIARKYENIKILQVGTYTEVQNAKLNKTALTSYSCVTVLVNKTQSLELAKAVNNGSIRIELMSYQEGIESIK